MDNLAHTLVGACIGRAIGADRVPAAGWIGAVVANTPDIVELVEGFTPFGGKLGYSSAHRGITHSLAGMGIEVVGITLFLGALFAVLRRRGRLQPVPPVLLAAVVAVALCSHLYLDWQGSYGIRPWQPWNERWYYADWVAITDPIFWVIPLVALAWGAERHWRDLIPFVLLGGLIVWAIIQAAGAAAEWLRWTCAGVLGLGAVGWVRQWFGVAARRQAAALALVVLALYVGAVAVASTSTKAAVRRVAEARFGPGASWAALTRVGWPFTWEPIYASRDTVAGPGWALPRHLDDPRVQWAMRQERGKGLGSFARFIAAEVDSGPGGVVVTLRDTRYARRGTEGWGIVTVPVPHGARFDPR